MINSNSYIGNIYSALDGFIMSIAIFKFISPLIATILIIGIIIQYKQKRYKVDKQKISKKNGETEYRRQRNKTKPTEIDKIYLDDNKLLDLLGNVEEPINKEKYAQLSLVFDNNGKVIQDDTKGRQNNGK